MESARIYPLNRNRFEGSGQCADTDTEAEAPRSSPASNQDAPLQLPDGESLRALD
jgi:hypothetical protein